MNKLLPLALLGIVIPVMADAQQHVVDDPQGDWGSRDPATGNIYLAVPEVDLLWVDVIPREDAVEISMHVDDLNHNTFHPTLQGYNFLFSWSHLGADGGYIDSEYVVAERDTFRRNGGLEYSYRFDYVTSAGTTHVEGRFDWPNDNVVVEVPLISFQRGDKIAYGIAWSRTEPHSFAGIHNGEVEFGDRAPNDGWGSGEVQIP